MILICSKEKFNFVVVGKLIKIVESDFEQMKKSKLKIFNFSDLIFFARLCCFYAEEDANIVNHISQIAKDKEVSLYDWYNVLSFSIIQNCNEFYLDKEKLNKLKKFYNENEFFEVVEINVKNEDAAKELKAKFEKGENIVGECIGHINKKYFADDVVSGDCVIVKNENGFSFFLIKEKLIITDAEIEMQMKFCQFKEMMSAGNLDKYLIV